MSGVAFIQLERLMIRVDKIVSLRELGRLGLPGMTLTEIATDREKYYVETEFDVIVDRLRQALIAVGS